MRDAVTVVSDLSDHVMRYRVEESVALFADDFVLHISGSYSSALTVRGKNNVVGFYAPFLNSYSIDAMKQEEPPEQAFTHVFGHDDWVAVRLEVTERSNIDKEPIIPVFPHPDNNEWARGVEEDVPRQQIQAILHVMNEKIDEVWVMVHGSGQRQKLMDAVKSANAEKENQRKKGKNKRK